MTFHNRLTLIFGLPGMIFILSLFVLWTMELTYVISAPDEFPVNFRDPKELGLTYQILAPIVWATFPISLFSLPIVTIFVAYYRLIRKVSFNRLILLFAFGAYSIFISVIVNFKLTPDISKNPLTAFTWFLD